MSVAQEDLFSFPRADVLTPTYVPTNGATREAIREPTVGTLGLPTGEAAVSLLSDSGISPTAAELAKQFVVFQLSKLEDGPTILEASHADPEIQGSDQQPDMLVGLSLESFHVGLQEGVDPDTKATMRITFGKDPSSTDKYFDLAYWCVAAGLNLYNDFKETKTEAKELQSDLQQAFGKRPIEIPGSLGILSFEVVKHKEPKWWQRIFKFLESETGKSLISVLGFPAIALQAVGLIDEFLSRILDSEPDPLFKSAPLRLALSGKARTDYSAGNPRVRVGVLNPGFSVLARGSDFEAVAGSNALYYPQYGRLVPSDVSEGKLLTGQYDDPLKDVTYAVFRVGMQETKLDPTFNFGSPRVS